MNYTCKYSAVAFAIHIIYTKRKSRETFNARKFRICVCVTMHCGAKLTFRSVKYTQTNFPYSNLTIENIVTNFTLVLG